MAIITISRGTFSGGKAIAEELAGRLGCPCVSREIIFDAAKEYGVSEAELNNAFITPPRFWKQAPGKRFALLNLLRAALLNLSKDGNLVYHGFAGHHLLRGVSHVLRVRVIAGMEYRIKTAMEFRTVTRDQAVAMIRKRDRQSSNWARFLYGVDWQAPFLYDVILNHERISVKSAAETLVHMTELEEFKPTDASREAFADLLLGSRVWAALFKDPRTRSANIRVEARKGHVTVAGDADSEQIVDAIRDVALRVEGVKGVTCDIGVGFNWLW